MGQTYSNTSSKALLSLYSFEKLFEVESLGTVYIFVSEILKKKVFVV